MGQRARPVDVVNGRMRILVVGQVDVFHREYGQFVGAHRIAAVFHVSSDGEQLAGGHDVRGRIDHNLVGRLEGDWVVFAERQGVERAIGRILGGALQRQVARTGSKLVLKLKITLTFHLAKTLPFSAHVP